MNIYAIKDNSSVKILDIFTAENDAVARLKMSQALFACKNPIGLDKRDLIRLGAINMETGAMAPEHTPVILVALNVLFDDLAKERKKYGC